MVKIFIYIIICAILLIINHLLINKKRYFFPIIIFVFSLIVTLISVVQIIDKEHNNSIAEVQTVENVTNIVDEDETLENESLVVIQDSNIQVSTRKSYFEIDLLCDFLLMNVPTGLCLADIYMQKRKKKELV